MFSIPVHDIVDYLPTHSEEEWDERDLNDIKYIVIHHSADEGNPWSIAQAHIDKGWPGIGYDTVITRDGTIFKTNLDKNINYHTGDFNKHSLGICLIGNFEEYPPSYEQLFSLLYMLHKYGRAYDVVADDVLGHKETPDSSTKCPGKFVDLDSIRGMYRMMVKG